MNQEQTLPEIYVRTLGGFSITIGDKTVTNYNNSSKKPWRLLEYLVTFRKREISPDELIELIWGDEDSSNPLGALKTLLFRSRKLLEPLDFPTRNLIVQQRGSYTWGPDSSTIVDADLFEDFVKQASVEGLSDEKRTELLLEAIALYQGDFLPQSGWEYWVVPISAYYHSLYLDVVHQAVDLLFEVEDYATIIDVCQRALAIENYDESLHCSLILALHRSDNNAGALDHYNHTVEMFYNEFAITPSDELKNLYKQIQENTNGVNTNIDIIQELIKEESYHKGAFFCEYTVFKDIYQLESRAIERTGDSIYICLLTVSDAGGQQPKTPVLIKAMAALEEAIRLSLRRGDVFCRYSISQYLILLPTATYENGCVALKRIINNFYKQYHNRAILVSYSLQAILPG